MSSVRSTFVLFCFVLGAASFFRRFALVAGFCPIFLWPFLAVYPAEIDANKSVNKRRKRP